MGSGVFEISNEMFKTCYFKTIFKKTSKEYLKNTLF